MRCPKCGADDQNAKFCGECGYQLIYSEPRASRTKVVEPLMLGTLPKVSLVPEKFS